MNPIFVRTISSAKSKSMWASVSRSEWMSGFALSAPSIVSTTGTFALMKGTWSLAKGWRETSTLSSVNVCAVGSGDGSLLPWAVERAHRARSRMDGAALNRAITRIVACDRLLARVGTAEATDAANVAKAESEIAKGDPARDSDRPGVAIEHYRNTWLHVAKK